MTPLEMNPPPPYRDEDSGGDDFKDEEVYQMAAVPVRKRRRRQIMLVAAMCGIVVTIAVLVTFSKMNMNDNNASGATTAQNNAPADAPSALTSSPTAADSTALTAAPTTPPTDSSNSKTKACLPDRFDNNEMQVMDAKINIKQLSPGQFICSKAKNGERRYRFGITKDTKALIWEDMQSGDRKAIYSNHNKNNTQNDHSDVVFSLQVDGTMVLSQNNNHSAAIWTAPPIQLKHPMSHTPLCLSNHDCPYLHLHSDGVMVLNWIAGDGAGWQAKNFLRVYGF